MKLTKKIAVIVNGPPVSGKDKFCEFFQESIERLNGTSKVTSSVDKVKIAAELLGWDGTKTQENRKALSDLKLLSESLWNGPMLHMIDAIVNGNENVTFLHIRELRNIDAVIQSCLENNIDVRTLYIHRLGEIVINNEGDRDAYDVSYPYQTIIDNNGTLEDLQNLAKSYAASVLTAKNAEPHNILSLIETYDSYIELEEASGGRQNVEKMIAEYMGGTFTAEEYEHPHSKREVIVESWKFPHYAKPGLYANIGIFDYSTSFDCLMPVAIKSKFTGTIYMNNVEQTFKEIALHVANNQ